MIVQGQELITKTTACPQTKIEVCQVTNYETRDRWIYDSLQESSINGRQKDISVDAFDKRNKNA